MILDAYGIDLQDPISKASINNGLLGWWMVLPHSGRRGGVTMPDLTTRAPGAFNRAIGTDTLQNYWKPNHFAFNKSERSYFNVGKKAQPTSKVTIAAWVKVNPDGEDYGRFFTSDDGNSYGALLYWVGGGVGYRFGVYTTAWTLIASTAVGTGEWVHAVGTYDGSNCRLYLNGRLAAGPTAQSGSINYNGRNAAIGGVYDSSNNLNFLKGNLRDLSVWDRALLNGEVLADYKDAKAGYPVRLNRPGVGERTYADFGGGGGGGHPATRRFGRMYRRRSLGRQGVRIN